MADYDAEDPEGDPITWSLEGDDLDLFMISTDGTVAFKEEPDYESPRDNDVDNDYELTVRAYGGWVSSLLFSQPYTLHDVTISVENRDEPGMVFLGSAQPQVNVALEAALSDPDEGVRSVTWTWARSTSRTSTGTVIDGETADTYTPVEGDVDHYLRVTASYTDGEGPEKTATAVSASAVEVAPVTNNAPEFPSAETGERSVTENAAAGENIGSPVAATDADPGDVLTYSLGGSSDDDSFVIDERTGQLKTGSSLDYEDRSRYFVTVTATDPSAARASRSVTINVVDVNEPPVVTGDTIIGYDENDTSTVASYTAEDPEGSDIVWGLSGTDQAEFTITDTGGLEFRNPPDFEAPAGANAYRVTVLGSDGVNAASLDVTVAVNNLDEAGTVTLSSLQPKTDSPLTATLRDPDGGISNARWVWERSTDRSDWTEVSGGVLATYTPVSADRNNYLRVTVTYDDAEGSDKTAQVESANPVQRGRTDNQGPSFPENENVSRSVNENSPAGTAVGGPVSATDPDEDDVLTYHLLIDEGGAEFFDIEASTGQIRTRKPLDYEEGDSYQLQVTATDPFSATATIPVTVNVTNLDEDGEVILSSLPSQQSRSSGRAARNILPPIAQVRQPRVGTPLNAELIDPDGEPSGVTWKWYRTSTSTGDGDPIPDARLSTYTPTEIDENRYLRAAATYTDPQGAGKEASAVSNAVQAAPSFTLSVFPLQINEGGRATITAATRSGDPATETVTIELFFGGSATEGRDYTLSAHSITIGAGNASATAVITTLSDRISEPDEDITISALHNGELAGSVEVTIRGNRSSRPTGPTNGSGSGPSPSAPSGGGGGGFGGGSGVEPLPPGSNLPPEFDEGTSTLREIAENTPAGANIGAPVTATDPEGDPLTYTLAGNDSANFDLDPATGQLRTRAPLDYETRNIHRFTILVSDGKNPTGDADARRDDSIRVTITVADRNDAGWVTLSAPTPRVDQPLHALVSDPDPGLTDPTWKWERSSDRSTWTPLEGATTDTYTPTTGDEGHYLRATATYTDGFGPGQTATATTAGATTAGHTTTYTDVTEDSVHAPAIDALAARGVFVDTECGPDTFCPSQPLQRRTMAVWLIRILSDSPLPTSGRSRFADIAGGQWWIRYAEELADRRITLGCGVNPPEYCPDRPVTRAQMASFLVRALQLPPPRHHPDSPTPRTTSTPPTSTPLPLPASPWDAAPNHSTTAPINR